MIKNILTALINILSPHDLNLYYFSNVSQFTQNTYIKPIIYILLGICFPPTRGRVYSFKDGITSIDYFTPESNFLHI